MTARELWNREIPKPDLKQVKDADPRVNDWVAARFVLRDAIKRAGGVQRNIEDALKTSDLARYEATLEFDEARRQLVKAIEQRKLELMHDPAVIKLYLPEVNRAVQESSAERKPFIVKIQIEHEASKEQPAVTIRTLCPDGRDRQYVVLNDQLPRVFPGIKAPRENVSNFVDRVTKELKWAGGLVIPFESFGKFHFVTGSLASIVHKSRDKFLHDLAKEQLETEKHPSLDVLIRHEQAKLEADRRYKTARERFRAQSTPRSILEDWSQALSLAKASLILNGRQGMLEVMKVARRYTLTLNTEPVLRVREDGRLECLSAWRKRDQFVITPVSRTESRAILQGAKRLSEINPGDFLTSGGKLIIGEPKAILGELFEAVSNALRVFPSDDVSKVIERNRGSSEFAQKQQYYTRHWAHHFIQGFSPDQVETGALSTDGHWRVYVFRELDRVIAEADFSGNATYVGRLNALPFFLNNSRTQILNEPPDGFLQRVIHQGPEEDRNTRWKDEISAILSGA